MSAVDAKVIVVGAGPIGAATARHLVDTGADVVIVGPDEPVDFRGHRGPWSGHYDQGRLAALDVPFIPTVLGRRAMRRFPQIEAESGVPFVRPHPVLDIFPREPPAGDLLGELAGSAANAAATQSNWTDIDALLANVAEFDGHAEVLDDDALRARFPDLRVPPGHLGVLQKDALIVNPRSLVRAELTLATRRGAELVRTEVIGLEPSSTGVRVRTRHGSVEGDLVVLATGAFTNACGLLSRRIDMMVFGCTIVLLEVDDPSKYDLPTLMPYVMSEGCQYAGIIVPPLTYPDGRSYIKGTGADLLSVPLESYEDIESWVRTGGSEAERDHFIDVFRTLLPAVQFGQVRVRPCLPSMNASGLPYIAFVDDRVVLATEGSRGVMMADEIGRLTARLAVKGRWDDPLPGELFRVGCV